MKYLGYMKYIILAIAIYLLFFYNIEGFSSMEKDIKKFAVCENCKIWNHLDAKSQCNKVCKFENIDKKMNFTGELKKDGNKTLCECVYKGKYKKEYIGCPTKKSLGETCFIWNNTEAQTKCPTICNKFIGDSAKWTGKWDKKNADVSVCECIYYD